MYGSMDFIDEHNEKERLKKLKEKEDKKINDSLTAYIPDFLEKNLKEYNFSCDKNIVFEELLEDFIKNDLPIFKKVFYDIGDLKGKALTFNKKFTPTLLYMKKLGLWTSKSEFIRNLFYFKILERIKNDKSKK